MCNCECGDSEHHKDMSHEERIEHLRECLDGAVERIHCVKDELDKIAAKK